MQRMEAQLDDDSRACVAQKGASLALLSRVGPIYVFRVRARICSTCTRLAESKTKMARNYEIFSEVFLCWVCIYREIVPSFFSGKRSLTYQHSLVGSSVRSCTTLQFQNRMGGMIMPWPWVEHSRCTCLESGESSSLVVCLTSDGRGILRDRRIRRLPQVHNDWE